MPTITVLVSVLLPKLFPHVRVKEVVVVKAPVTKLPPVVLLVPAQLLVPPEAVQDVGLLVGLQRMVVPVFVAFKLVWSAVRLTWGALPCWGATFTVAEPLPDRLPLVQTRLKVTLPVRVPVVKLPERGWGPAQLPVPPEALQDVALEAFQLMVLEPP